MKWNEYKLTFSTELLKKLTKKKKNGTNKMNEDECYMWLSVQLTRIHFDRHTHSPKKKCVSRFLSFVNCFRAFSFYLSNCLSPRFVLILDLLFIFIHDFLYCNLFLFRSLFFFGFAFCLIIECVLLNAHCQLIARST